MKHFLHYIVCGLAVLILFSCATIPDPAFSSPTPEHIESYTTDAEISPREIFEWMVVYITSPNEQGIYYIVSENPLLRLPIDCPIKYILCLIDNTKQRLVGYAYYLDGRLELYELWAKDWTLNSGHFMRSSVTERKRKVIDFYLLKFVDLDTERT